jgi:hypothetical protein
VNPSNTHNRTLGILWAIYGILLILGGIWLLLYEPVLTLMWGALLNRVPNPFTWMDLFHFTLYGKVILDFIAAIFSFLAAMALMQGSGSGRRLGLIAAFFGLISGPLGIALGAFTAAILIPQKGESFDPITRP